MPMPTVVVRRGDCKIPTFRINKYSAVVVSVWLYVVL